MDGFLMRGEEQLYRCGSSGTTLYSKYMTDYNTASYRSADREELNQQTVLSLSIWYYCYEGANQVEDEVLIQERVRCIALHYKCTSGINRWVI